MWPFQATDGAVVHKTRQGDCGIEFIDIQNEIRYDPFPGSASRLINVRQVFFG